MWPREKDCDISYKDVFSEEQFNDIPLLSVIELKGLGAYKNIPELIKRKRFKEIIDECIYRFKIESKIQRFMLGRKYIDYYPTPEIGWSGERYLAHQKACWEKTLDMLRKKREIFIRAYCGVIIDDDLQKQVRMDVIKFNPQYEKKVEEIVSGNRNWLGIHIRRTDHQRAIEYSKTEDFIRLMKKAQEENPQTRFFLATDDSEVEEELKRCFGSALVTQKNKIWGRDSEGGMESAIIDCLCLSRCNEIIGSYTSVFSSFSAAYGNKKLTICRKE